MNKAKGRMARSLALTCCVFAGMTMQPMAARAQTDLMAGVHSGDARHGFVRTAFGSTDWTIRDNAQIALIGAQNDPSGIFVGVQCDPFAPHAYRIIFGEHGSSRTSQARELSTMPLNKLSVKTALPSVSSRFDVAPEDSGQSDLGGMTDYVAAHLTPQQYAALSSAQTITIRYAQNDYQFAGRGSARAIAGLNCQTSPVHTARRLIEARREDMPRQDMAPWRLAFHAGDAASYNGSAETMAITTNNAVNSAAIFKVAIGCFNKRRYIRFGADIDALQNDGKQWHRASAFVYDLDRRAKLLEVYRKGQRARTIMIESRDGHGPGHALSKSETADLMQSDQVIVVGDNMVIEFSTRNLAASLTTLGTVCSTLD